jgi:hypothetical protein
MNRSVQWGSGKALWYVNILRICRGKRLAYVATSILPSAEGTEG